MAEPTDSGSHIGQAAMPENKGVLWGKSLEEATAQGINLTGDNIDMKHLFGDLEGSALLEQIFKFWGDDKCDVPWFFDSSGDAATPVPQKKLRSIICYIHDVFWLF